MRPREEEGEKESEFQAWLSILYNIIVSEVPACLALGLQALDAKRAEALLQDAFMDAHSINLVECVP